MLNDDYYSRVSYEEDFDLRSKSELANKFSNKLRKLMIMWGENFHHTQKLLK